MSERKYVDQDPNADNFTQAAELSAEAFSSLAPIQSAVSRRGLLKAGAAAVLAIATPTILDGCAPGPTDGEVPAEATKVVPTAVATARSPEVITVVVGRVGPIDTEVLKRFKAQLGISEEEYVNGFQITADQIGRSYNLATHIPAGPHEGEVNTDIYLDTDPAQDAESWQKLTYKEIERGGKKYRTWNRDGQDQPVLEMEIPALEAPENSQPLVATFRPTAEPPAVDVKDALPIFLPEAGGTIQHFGESESEFTPLKPEDVGLTQEEWNGRYGDLQMRSVVIDARYPEGDNKPIPLGFGRVEDKVSKTAGLEIPYTVVDTWARVSQEGLFYDPGNEDIYFMADIIVKGKLYKDIKVIFGLPGTRFGLTTFAESNNVEAFVGTPGTIFNIPGAGSPEFSQRLATLASRFKLGRQLMYQFALSNHLTTDSCPAGDTECIRGNTKNINYMQQTRITYQRILDGEELDENAVIGTTGLIAIGK